MVLLLCVERLKGIFLQQELNECRLTKLRSEVVTGFNLTYGQKIIIFSYVFAGVGKVKCYCFSTAKLASFGYFTSEKVFVCVKSCMFKSCLYPHKKTRKF